VIEHVTARLSLPIGQRGETFCGTTIAGGGEISHFIDLTFQNTSFGRDNFVGSEAVRLYADGPGRVLCTAWKSVSGGDNAFANWSFSGHLVDAP